MPLPRAVARFNKRVTNRFLEPIARRSAKFAVVHHLGRTSARKYATPLALFAIDASSTSTSRCTSSTDGFVVSLTYGPSADWVQNVLAGGGTVENATGHRRIDSARIADRAEAWPALPLVVRGAARALGVDEYMHLELLHP